MAINRNALKTYAPKARLDFIQAMKNRAALFGITKDGASDGELKGEVYIVEGRPWPKYIAEQRRRLVARIRHTSFDQVMEAVAYTWFNRFLAIRYMEVHDYFDHGFRVLSSPKGDTEPQILAEAAHLGLPGLKHDEVIKLKLDGTQDEVLYRKILIAQCNDLHRAMPFLFEKIEDETELLLPENLLQSDSIVRKLVSEIDEAEWDQIEIIGWLYQFYISDKKDQVIGKVVKSEDIPAATQLFTPNWIVKYMVQNSLGATWLGTYPDSPLKGQMNYYIEPAEQTPEVMAQLAAITPKSLDPEALTLIDPAVGSGHILVEAYDLFKAIYTERGYSAREAARLILTKNLYGLDIDDRAAQMAGFALLMKARADDRSLLRDPPILNVRSLQESNGIDADAMIEVLLPKARIELFPSGDLLPETLAQPTLAVTTNADAGNKTAHAIRGLLDAFKNAKTYGSLITVSTDVLASLPLLESLLSRPGPSDLIRRGAYQDAIDALTTIMKQAKILAQNYDCAIANPPYMGGKYHNNNLKLFLKNCFRDSLSDTYTSFIQRCLLFSKSSGKVAMVTLPSWLSLPTYSDLRHSILSKFDVLSLLENGRGVWGPDFGSCTFILTNYKVDNFVSTFKRLFDRRGEVSSNEEIVTRFFQYPPILLATKELSNIPGSPIAYWTSPAIRTAFSANSSVGDFCETKNGMTTGDNDRFLRFWPEVSYNLIQIQGDRTSAGSKNVHWVPYSKGGAFRKWYGNNELLLYWKNGGSELNENENTIIRNPQFFFLDAITWSLTSMLGFGARYRPSGFAFDVNGMSLFTSNVSLNYVLALLNSSAAKAFLEILNPTIAFQSGDISRIPFVSETEAAAQNAGKLIQIAKDDWDSLELSWDFQQNQVLKFKSPSLEAGYEKLQTMQGNTIDQVRKLEIENNAILSRSYKLEQEISIEVSLSEIALNSNPYFRYGNDLPEVELQARLKSDTMRELISYAVGCMMGRYSLAGPGLIYAHSGNENFDPSRYGAFPADADGIIPMTEEAWFDDDAAYRIEEFLGVAWPDSSRSDNLAFLMDGLIKGHSEDPHGDLRDYLSKKFYPDHLQTYKNRPIYWLFSSGKLKAFECLVYLHRYNEGTLARMRTEYVTPLMGKMSARIEGFESEILTSSSTSEKAAKTRTATKLRKQLEELRTFDEELHHLADRRIALDLDDGVKVNYGKFGDLLAFKTKVCGKDDSE